MHNTLEYLTLKKTTVKLKMRNFERQKKTYFER
jgi:hypothetical protein